MSDLENNSSIHGNESQFSFWLWSVLACILFSLLAISAVVYATSLYSGNYINGLWTNLSDAEPSLHETLDMSPLVLPRNRNDTYRLPLPSQVLKQRSQTIKLSRKLIATGFGMGKGHVDRVGDGCSMEDIAIFQGETGPMPNGIPSYTVQIFNLCFSGCPIKDIHVSCGWFASATLVNPKLFKRVRYDDCVVNNGKPLAAGQSLTFQYANSFQYPFSIANAEYACPH